MTDSHYTCYYCKLTHPEVEAGGIYYCPNFLCTGPGGHTHRAKLASYRETENDRHTVDPEEWRRAGLAHADTLDAKDPALAARIRADAKDET